ncbi:type I secretion system permease/ATPase [Nisaea sediminum]|uniref:type I secretion system permease/ATPase n=1 Tax=Nisaea sediminum TaxID=2775867 RepID=UPI001868E4E6|nr:type I secretion system permease/ATPase [Nisaea sediminum]
MSEQHKISPSATGNPVTSVLRRSTRAVLFALLLSLVTSLLMLVPPLYMINIFNKVLLSHSYSTLFGISVAAIIGVSLYVVFDFFRSKIFLLTGTWLGQQLNENLLEAGLGRSLRGKGNISETLRDIGDLRQFVSGQNISAGMEVLWSPIFFLALFILHPVYFTVALAGAAVLVVLAIANEILVRKPTAEAKHLALVAYNDLGDALRNAEVIEGMGLMRHVLQRWRRANDQTIRTSQVAEQRASQVRSISRGIQFVGQMSIIAAGAYLVVQGEVIAATLVAAMMISGRALQPFGSVISSWREWVNARAVLQRLNALVAEDLKKRPRSTMPLPRPSGQLDVDRLVFAAPGAPQPIIRNVSFSVQPGEFVAIIGPSAAGKSTLAKLLVGVWAPTAGSIRLDGHDVYTWNRDDFGQYVGYLPQQVELFSGTVRENISRLTEAPAPKVIEAAKRAGVHAMIGRFPHGYDTDVGTFGAKLTGGQSQRIGLARALFGNPPFLVLDEPDASLDMEGQQSLVSALEDAKANGSTSLVVSHRSALIKLADRIIVMREGTIERIARPDDLLFDERGFIGVKGQGRRGGHLVGMGGRS